MRRTLMILILALPLTAGAEPLFMKDSLKGREFFDPWGVGVDVFTMKQDYQLKKLEFDLPGVAPIDPEDVDVTNEINHIDVKLDVWLTPFLNVFGLVGHMSADTNVDLGGVALPGLPITLGTLPVDYDGTVYGGGVNLLYATERWFVAWNNTWTDADISGDFDSSVTSFISQPRIGLIRGSWMGYVGGMYLDTEETHKGNLDLGIPGLGAIPFSVELDNMDEWNYAVGVAYVFSPKAHLSLEIGFGDRDHTLFNYTYRF